MSGVPSTMARCISVSADGACCPRTSQAYIHASRKDMKPPSRERNEKGKLRERGRRAGRTEREKRDRLFVATDGSAANQRDSGGREDDPERRQDEGRQAGDRRHNGGEHHERRSENDE
jgi:hypothetical protein